MPPINNASLRVKKADEIKEFYKTIRTESTLLVERHHLDGSRARTQRRLGQFFLATNRWNRHELEGFSISADSSHWWLIDRLQLYPSTIAEVRPQAKHQPCVFHAMGAVSTVQGHSRQE